MLLDLKCKETAKLIYYRVLTCFMFRFIIFEALVLFDFIKKDHNFPACA